MSEKEEGTANITTAELKAAKSRKHPIDEKSFISVFKKIMKSHKAGGKNMIRIHAYRFKEVNDGWMLKLKMVKYFSGRSAGPRWIKGYLSEALKVDFKKQLDTLPRKTYTDSRDNTQHETPQEIVQVHRLIPKDIAIADLWNVEEK